MNPEIEIKTFYAGSDRPLEVQVSFVMSYHDWCLLQKTKSWADFRKALTDIQK